MITSLGEHAQDLELSKAFNGILDALGSLLKLGPVLLVDRLCGILELLDGGLEPLLDLRDDRFDSGSKCDVAETLLCRYTHHGRGCLGTGRGCRELLLKRRKQGSVARSFRCLGEIVSESLGALPELRGERLERVGRSEARLLNLFLQRSNLLDCALNLILILFSHG